MKTLTHYKKILLAMAVITAAFGITANQLFAAIVQPGFEEEVVADGFTLATAMAFAPDGRIFVAEKGGTVRVIKNGALLAEPVITLTDINTFGDRGLLGIATDPNFAANGYLYLSYTFENTPGANFSAPKTGRIIRVTVVGDVASESSKVVLAGSVGGTAATPSCEDYAVTADCIASDSSSHSVGGLRFGPDGKLYATLGDGADFSAVDPRALRAQNVDALAGKVLRINPDGTAPADNPFYNGNPNANRSKVFALGVRNSFRLNFHPTTGVLYAGDVGWSTWEEINKVTAGANLGWPCREGNGATTYNCTPSSSSTNPVYTYAHNASGAGSITAGAFVANGAYPAAYNNTMFIGDYAQNWIKILNLDANGNFVSVQDFIPDSVYPVDLSTGPDGNVYYLDIGYASVNRITHTTGNRRPVVELAANPTSGLTPLTVNFSSAGSYDPDTDPFTYQWNFGDGTSATSANPTHVYTTNGTYSATLTLTDNHGSNASKSVTITAGNQAPTATIVSPASGALYQPLEQVQLQGTATDPENGTLPASAYHWQVILHHNTHIHVVQDIVGVQNPTFTADDHNDPDVYMEIMLTVTDSVGLTSTKSINMYLDHGGGAANLVSNPSVEIQGDGVNANTPIDWTNGWYGVLNPTFTYPVAGFEGSKAMQLTVTNYQSGSAKWFFSPVFVSSNKEYTFTNTYTATAASEVYAVFGFANGTYQYVLLDTPPATATPTNLTYTVTTPTDVQTMTVFHQLAANGTLVTDNFSLSLTTTTPPPANNNLIQNGDFETVNGNAPLGWAPNSWGNHTAAHTYPVAGWNGGKAVRTEITSYPANGTGDAKWTFTKVPVTPGTIYTYSDQYRSNTISDIIGQYTLQNGSFHYFGLAKEIQPNTAWQTLNATFTPPVDATHVTFFHLISAVGFVEIDDAELHVTGTGTPSETIPPVVEFTNPLAGQTVSGTVNITASSSDNVAVTYVFYAVDGIPITGQLHDAPYTYAWNSASVADGTHTLKATTHDPSGNNSTHTITFTVDNTTTPPPTGNNLILNPSLETDGTGGNPAQWLRGGWGTNTRTFTYPTAGVDGTDAAKVEITSFTNGDAKWYFADVPVTVGTTYHFSHQYKANIATEMLARFTRTDGTVQYGYLGALPASANWAVTNYDITIPANVVSMTVFHVIAGVGVLEIDDFSLEAPGGADTTAPTVSVTAPVGNATVSGTTTVTVDAADNVGVTSVTLLIDGAASSTDTTAPYSFVWNTQSVTDGTHTLAAVARDAAANTATSSNVTVTVSNTTTPPPTGDSLVLNPSLETAQAGNPNMPANWKQSGWGTSNRTFTYPVAGTHGVSAARVEVSGYASGDAKWYFDDVNVQSGELYTFTHSYKASAPTNITLRYTRANGTVYYIGLGNRPATETWNTVTDTFVIPADAVSMTIFHSVISNGWLEVDNYLLTGGTTNAFNTGMISFTFDDGWLSQYTEVLPRLNAANVDGVFYIISQETLGATNAELIPNANLENAGATDPVAWHRGGWGTNTTVHTYPAAGVDGNKAAMVEITDYTSGDAKWFFDEAVVDPGYVYHLKNSYKSTVESEVLIRYTMIDDTTQYEFLKWLPSSGDTWQQFEQGITVPENVKSLTVFHLIHGVGSLSVDNYSLKRTESFVSPSQVLEMQSAGHEIGSHTQTHPYLTQIGAGEANNEIEDSKADLLGMGVTSVSTIAYPYGDYNDEIKTLTNTRGYVAGRSVDRGYNTKDTDKYALKIQQMDRTTTMADVQGWVQQAIADKTWLILMFHQVNNDMTADLGVTPEFLTDVLNYVNGTSIDVVTVQEGVAQMNP